MVTVSELPPETLENSTLKDKMVVIVVYLKKDLVIVPLKMIGNWLPKTKPVELIDPLSSNTLPRVQLLVRKLLLQI